MDSQSLIGIEYTNLYTYLSNLAFQIFFLFEVTGITISTYQPSLGKQLCNILDMVPKEPK